MASARGELSGYSKGSGGPGGGGGYNFQARATAFVYAHLLAGQPLTFAAQRYPVPLAVWAESGGPGDDLRVECQDGVVVEVQAKRGLSAGEKFWDRAYQVSCKRTSENSPSTHPVNKARRRAEAATSPGPYGTASALRINLN